MPASDRRIAFLVKNYVGLGHIRRALLVADELRRTDPRVDIVFVSQARSLRLLASSPYRVVNFPFLYTMPSLQAADAYRKILNTVLDYLRPNLVVEDTYPDDMYLAAPGLANVPRVLLLRRVDPLYLDGLRSDGLLARYERVIAADDLDGFLAEGQTPAVEMLARLGRTFRFVGPVFQVPAPDEIADVRRRHRTGEERVVVVNAGGGGELANEAFCERLFATAAQVAERFRSRSDRTRFVLVTGPYFDGVVPDPAPNLEILRYEPNLAALLHEAWAAVLRPGFNATYEALAGCAHLVVTPTSSYHECQAGFARRLEAQGVVVAAHDDVDSLDEALAGLVAMPPAVRQVRPAQDHAATEILSVLEDVMENADRRPSVFVTLGVPSYALEAARALVRTLPVPISLIVPDAAATEHEIPCATAVVRTSGGALGRGSTAFVQSNTGASDPRTLADHGVAAVLHSDASNWCERYEVRAQRIFDLRVHRVAPRPGQPLPLPFVSSRLLAQSTLASIHIDLVDLTPESIDTAFGELGSWIDGSNYRFINQRSALHHAVTNDLVGTGAQHA